MEATDKKYCVYMHKNKINNKVYIGQTGTSVEDRWQNGRGYKGCTLFERAIQKYGWDNFEHIILEDNLTREEVGRSERKFIMLYDSTNPEKGYNISTGGESGHIGVKMSDEVRKKMSEARKGVPFSQEHKDKISEALKGRTISEEQKQKIIESNSMSVVQLSKNGDFIREYISSEEASRITGINASNISASSRSLNHNKTAGGFLWIKSSEYWNLETKDIKYINRGLAAVVQLDKSGKYINEFVSCAEAQRAIGKPKSNKINTCCRGDIKSAYGFIWVYKNEYDNTKDYSFKREPYGNQYAVVQIDNYGNLVSEFDTVQNAHNATNINYCCICECCNGTQKTAGGFKWMRKSDWDNLQATVQN